MYRIPSTSAAPLAVLAALALAPEPAAAQFRLPAMRPPLGGPIVPLRNPFYTYPPGAFGTFGVFTPYTTRPFYSTYDPLGFNYLQRYNYYGRYPYTRFGPGVYFLPAYVPTYETYLSMYPPIEGWPPPALVPPAPPAEPGPPPRMTTATVEVYVPTGNAEVWFNGVPTKTMGERRE